MLFMVHLRRTRRCSRFTMRLTSMLVMKITATTRTLDGELMTLMDAMAKVTVITAAEDSMNLVVQYTIAMNTIAMKISLL